MNADETKTQFRLESLTVAQSEAEAERERQRREITRRLAKPLKGSGEVNVQPQLDLGGKVQDGQQDLFEPIVELTFVV